MHWNLESRGSGVTKVLTLLSIFLFYCSLPLAFLSWMMLKCFFTLYRLFGKSVLGVS